MQLKNYVAPTIQEALRKIKADLGEEAMIFSSRTVTSQGNGTNRKKSSHVQVTAAIDRNNGHEQVMKDGCEDVRATCNSLKGTVPPALTCGHKQFHTTDKGIPFASPFIPYLKKLLMAGFDYDMAWYLIGEAGEHYQQGTDCDDMEKILSKKIVSRVPIAGPLNVLPNRKKVAAFVGPTGVGKTTTLAKIAARYKMMGEIKVKMVTMDTFRIGAAEQLKLYGKIMDIPVAVAGTFQDLQKEVRDDNYSDLILLDTAGRNFRDSDKIDEQNSFINALPGIESHLLLNATTTADVLEETVQCFCSGTADSLIITKVDESLRLGHLYNLVLARDIPLSYITTGQHVPEDIQPVSEHILSKIFLHGFYN